MNRKIFLLTLCLVVSPPVFADFTQQLQNAGVSRAGIALLEKNGLTSEAKLKTLTRHKPLLDMGMHTEDALAVVQLARQLNQADGVQQAEPSKPAANKTFKNSIGMEFVLIPAGEFMMGTDCIPKATPGCREDETPPHKVKIAEPFYLGQYEVTQAQWYKIMRTNPSSFNFENVSGDTTQHPVETIQWHEAQAFVQKLNEKENCRDCYFLPTEAQWEYAARAGTTTAYYFGDDPAELGKYAWFSENAEEQTQPVGKKQPNQWGLYDMLGNVWEWTCSQYAAYGDKPGMETQCVSKDNAKSSVVLRGGGWVINPAFCRAAARYYNTPGNRSSLIGLRVARRVAPRTP